MECRHHSDYEKACDKNQTHSSPDRDDVLLTFELGGRSSRRDWPCHRSTTRLLLLDIQPPADRICSLETGPSTLCRVQTPRRWNNPGGILDSLRAAKHCRQIGREGRHSHQLQRVLWPFREHGIEMSQQATRSSTVFISINHPSAHKVLRR